VTPRTWCRKRSPAWPASTWPPSTIPRPGWWWSPAVYASTGCGRGGGTRPTPLEVAEGAADPFNPGAVDPADQVTLVDNVTLAMHALLQRLSPAERTSFVLHDVFQYPFEEVATIVGRGPDHRR